MNTNLIVPQFLKPRQLVRQVGGRKRAKRRFFIPMASSSASTGGETFARGAIIKFGSLDFLAIATSEPCLVHYDNISGGSPTSSTPGVARVVP